MNEQQRPIFGFLWPKPSGAVDAEATQERLIRIPARGFVRIALLVVASLLIVMVTAGAVVAAIGTHPLILIPVAALVATFWVLALRAWSVGTFVNDRGVVVVSMLATRATPWRDVASVRDVDGRVDIVRRDGRVLSTHVHRGGIDLLGSAERYDMARLALQRWGEQR